MESRLPLAIALLTLALGGWWLLERSDAQARDTIRKHHLDDIEHALYFARDTHGTFPPYDSATWCGQLNAPANRAVRDQVEAALRQQHEKYANPAKPFPTDPRPDLDYFYWKRSPAMFELYANLEAAATGERNTLLCPTTAAQYYDYGLLSVEREETGTFNLLP
jgi:hypothetical protein